MAAGARFDEVVATARVVAGPAADLEAALRYMRSEGMSPIESIKGIMIIGQVSLAEAKNIVHHSVAWADIRADQERFQQALAEEVEREL
jgi:hypothetical protein